MPKHCSAWGCKSVQVQTKFLFTGKQFCCVEIVPVVKGELSIDWYTLLVLLQFSSSTEHCRYQIDNKLKLPECDEHKPSQML